MKVDRFALVAKAPGIILCMRLAGGGGGGGGSATQGYQRGRLIGAIVEVFIGAHLGSLFN